MRNSPPEKNRIKKLHRIAVIPGDGIGTEVISEGVKCLKTLSEIFKNLQFQFEYFPWGSEYYLQNDRMMPEDGLEILKNFNAIYLGAVGDPRIPDDITLHGLLLPIKFGFDLYVGLRPVYLFPGVESPLANISEGEIDIAVIRENTEGEYSNIGGIVGIEIQIAQHPGVTVQFGIHRIPAGEGQHVVVVVHVHFPGQGQLAVVVHALQAARLMFGRAQRRQQQRRQDGNDGDDHEQFNEREASQARSRAADGNIRCGLHHD